VSWTRTVRILLLGADGFGLPVSATHVLSSGVAGTMAASGCGLQMATLRNIAIAWFFYSACGSDSFRLALLGLQFHRQVGFRL
jgi:phosphate/sulfate permease